MTEARHAGPAAGAALLASIHPSIRFKGGETRPR